MPVNLTGHSGRKTVFVTSALLRSLLELGPDDTHLPIQTKLLWECVHVYIPYQPIFLFTWLLALPLYRYISNRWGFPGGSVVKNPPDNARDVSLTRGLGRSPGEGNGNPLQYSCLGNSMDRGAWWVTVHGAAKELGTIYTLKNTNNKYTYIHSFVDSIPLQVIMEYWVEFFVLYNRFLLVTYVIYSS